MYLKSFTLSNFRKFRVNKNEVFFAYEKIKNKDADEKIDISNTSTLIVGKNNVGKTSITSALEKLIGRTKFRATDFNFHYLNEFLIDFREKKGNIKLYPEIYFKMVLELDDNEDIITNIAPLLFLDNTESATLHIKIRIKETEPFKDELNEVINTPANFENDQFNSLLKLIDNIGLECIYLNNDMQEIKEGFNLKDLIEIKSIKANKITHENSLTRAFNKIIEYRHKNSRGKQSTKILEDIKSINTQLTEEFQKSHESHVNESLGEIEHYDRLAIKLTSELTHEKLLENNILMYKYAEKGLAIPENQYGLGYTNLVMIIAEIIKYIEEDPEDSFTSKINIISIEEPETFMHPQMQELFIKNINASIEKLLESKEKYVNSQILITTHSSHILNSKIHSGNSFNHMNYLTDLKDTTQIVNLEDRTIITIDEKKEKSNDKFRQLEFLKKHIKYKVSELFFSDAIIFVEGVTEETLLRYWIDEKHGLQKYYISIFNIDGAHGLVYHNLIKQLKIPALIITDLDIIEEEKDSDSEKYNQIESLAKKETTNKTISKYFGKDLTDIEEKVKKVESNIYLSIQQKIDDYYPTSFEEAIILTNYDTELLQTALEKTKPLIYKEIHKGNNENIKEKSRLFQHKLSNSKSEFSNRILFELVNIKTADCQFDMPKYIDGGLNELEIMLERGE